ncbi:uncharacterized protein N7479_007167 [Penicillium vulpinum]|uniref:uncharacterized protein n=1 Tax=Penicillium vulpinum TaxID=29845 RepID=UPI0025468B5C|nr:uncharacterized protein N7479_007167 [Penicillium vulpinum]KAJ5960017.1 hypothetical protein N7479_007167 [Penicillium vulpinum]
MNQPTIPYLLTFVLSVAFIYYRVTKRIPSRLIADQAPRSRFELVPVKSYNVPARGRGVDIIFVHGLGSNPDTTWRARRSTNTSHPIEETRPNGEQYVNWVSDFLPSDLPPEVRKDARIFFYNYDSYWKRDAVYTRLQSVGTHLLEHIDGQIRQLKHEQGRYLIFVGHSYGGLVVKEALIRAKRIREFNQIVEQTRAILFLGTPHRGTSFGPWGRLAAFALQPLGSNPLILANLEYDSLVLSDLHEHFITSIRDDLQVVNFYEQRPLCIFQLWFFRWQIFCVPEGSATYPGVGKIGLAVDHYGLNKFESRNECYNSILSKLSRILTPLVEPTKHLYSVPLETVQTFTQRDQLWKELEEKLQIRHESASVPFAVTLHGLGGQLALKFTESNVNRFNPILWIDATREETVRSSFIRCAAEIGLPEEQEKQQSTALVDDRVIQGVLRWLRDRTEVDDEWLVIVDNADDFTWGLRKLMPKGTRGKIVITSRDDQSQKLIDRGCEKIRIDIMSPREARLVLLRHLSDDIDLLPKSVQNDCDEVANKLGYLPLALDLAGAYIGNSIAPEQSVRQYLEDYVKHRDELLQMNHLRGLSPTERTVWTVWDTTLEKIETEYTQLQPGLLLTFLAHFQGTIVQDEMFRLASLGMSAVVDEFGEGVSTEIRMFLPETEGKWDNFTYRHSIDVLARYSLIQRVHGEWPGTIMHSLVQWRAIHRDQNQQWEWWYTKFVLAACSQIKEEDHQPQFRRHLILHVPDVRNIDLSCIKNIEMGEVFIWNTLARVHYDEGRWEAAEQLEVQVMETSKTKLGEDHPDTLTSMANLASTYRNQGRWEAAEQLFVQVIETSKTKLGEDHPDTLTSIANLASTYRNQGRWEAAEQLEVQVIETRKTKLGEDYPSTLTSMANLASTYRNQGRWEEAEQLEVQVMETRKTKLGEDHPDTLASIANLASTYRNQGRWEAAEQLEVQVMETRKTKLGEDHPSTLTSIANLASTYRNQGRWEAAEQLEVQVMETRKTKLGEDHPDTLASIANLASTFWNQGRWEEAEQLEVQVIETRKTKLGEDHPSTLTSMANLASTYRNQGRWEAAEQLFVQVIETSKTKLGEDHPDTLTSMANLASTYRNQGRWKAAEQLFIQVIETSKTKLGEDHPNTLASTANLASTFWNQGRWEAAEQLFIQVIETSKMKLGEDHPDTLTSIANLASTYRNQGRWEAAEQLEVQVIETRKTKLGEDHPDTLTSMANLASTFWNQGRWEEAEQLEVQVIEISKTKLGEDHPDTLTSMANLAFTWKSAGHDAEAISLLRECLTKQKQTLGLNHPTTLSNSETLLAWETEVAGDTEGEWQTDEEWESDREY